MPLSEANPLPKAKTKKDSASVEATLFEQLGSNDTINKNNLFTVDLPVGGTEGTIDPLPDIAEIT